MSDYGRIADALACGGVAYNGYQLLKPETIALLRSEQIAKLHAQNEFTCVQGGDYSYGLGVRTRVRPTAWGLMPGEFGWDGAADSYVMIDPNRHISIFVGMHIKCWPKLLRDFHLRLVEEIYKNL